MSMEQTPRLKKVIDLARIEASGVGASAPGSEHLLLGIALEGGSVPAKVLAKYGIDPDGIRRDLSGAASSDDLLAAAEAVALKLGHDVVGTEHLLLALIEDWDTAAARLLIRKGVSPREVSKVILDLLASQ
ncbi:MAG TPA: Clp protease N-terminal domain-containing protein [Planctomycetota bacterium]